MYCPADLLPPLLMMITPLAGYALGFFQGIKSVAYASNTILLPC
jgi:hypothetical protein